MRIRPVLPAVALSLLFLAPSASPAREYRGVTFSETQTAGPAAVKLVGVGLRKKVVIAVYLGALYLEAPAKNAAEVISSDQPKRVVLHFLYRNVSPEQLVEAWNEGFKNNNPAAKVSALKDRITAFNGFFSGAVKTGDTIVITYVPGAGTSVSVKGEMKGIIRGKDFMEALFSIWFGPKPPSEELKNGMLGGK